MAANRFSYFAGLFLNLSSTADDLASQPAPPASEAKQCIFRHRYASVVRRARRTVLVWMIWVRFFLPDSAADARWRTERSVVKMRLRTKFLLSLLAISAGLTSATLFIVRYSVQNQVRDSLQVDLQNSVKTYQSFDLQRNDALTHSAALLANLPNVRALMTTRDAATIQDATADVWRQSGDDLLAFASGSGDVLGITDRGFGI